MYITWELLLDDAWARTDLAAWAQGPAHRLLAVRHARVRDRRQRAAAVAAPATAHTDAGVRRLHRLHAHRRRVPDPQPARRVRSSARVVDVGWVIGLLLIAAGALVVPAAGGHRSRPRDRVRASNRRVLFGSLITFVPFVLVFVVHVPPVVGPRRRSTSSCSRCSVVLFVVAQLATLRENLALTSGLESTRRRRAARSSERAPPPGPHAARRRRRHPRRSTPTARSCWPTRPPARCCASPRPTSSARRCSQVLTLGPGDHSLLVRSPRRSGARRRSSRPTRTIRRIDGTTFIVQLYGHARARRPLTAGARGRVPRRHRPTTRSTA